jgi:murein DD-endopeptidase MepM/ murein hydrolase activator NlpD
MQQRYYDPLLGRFLSVDPVTAYSSPGVNFNRYWYANNNPYKFVDPDGRWIRPFFHQGEGAQVLPTAGAPIAILPTEKGEITSGFGNRIHPVTKESKLHNGTDFRARFGESVRSTQNGQVVSIYSGGPGGNQIVIRNHDGSMSGYAHVSPVDGVEEGGAVKRGQKIATSDGSGRITAPHLHYTYKPGTVESPATKKTKPADAMKNQFKKEAQKR